jgi:hypothetical protein
MMRGQGRRGQHAKWLAVIIGRCHKVKVRGQAGRECHVGMTRSPSIGYSNAAPRSGPTVPSWVDGAPAAEGSLKDPRSAVQPNGQNVHVLGAHRHSLFQSVWTAVVSVDNRR